MMLAIQSPCLAEINPVEVALHLYEGAERYCHASYGENHVASDEKNAMKYYCQRLQHPVEFLQDQDWWKNNLPAGFQAGPRPIEISEGEKRLQDFEKKHHDALFQCKLNGGSDGDCWMCVIRSSGATHQLPSAYRTVDPTCRRLLSSHLFAAKQRAIFALCKLNGGTDRICETCSAPLTVPDPACRPYLDRSQMDRFEHCQDLQCRICASSPLMARKPECAAYQ